MMENLISENTDDDTTENLKDLNTPETVLKVEGDSTIASTVVVGLEKATGGATIVEGAEAKAGPAGYGEKTLGFISKEAAEAAVRTSATLPYGNAAAFPAYKPQNEGAYYTNSQEIKAGGELPVNQLMQTDVLPTEEIQPVAEDKMSKGVYFISFILAVASAVASFIGVTYLLQR